MQIVVGDMRAASWREDSSSPVDKTSLFLNLPLSRLVASFFDFDAAFSDLVIGSSWNFVGTTCFSILIVIKPSYLLDDTVETEKE
jgi:hypothetical protein